MSDTYWTAYVAWPADRAALALDGEAFLAVARESSTEVEEVDSEASTEEEARAEIEARLHDEYEPGWRIVCLENRVHGIVYF